MPPKRKHKQAPRGSADLVMEQLPLLRILTKTKNAAARREILNQSPESVRAIGSIANNLMQGTIPLSQTRYNQIKKKFSKIVYLVAQPRVSLSRKRKAIQTGGFLPLVGAVLPVVVKLLSAMANAK